MSNRMWGGRFASAPSDIMEEINASIDFDKRLAPQDIRGSLAHAAMLAATGILSAEDAAAIEKGLRTIQEEVESGAFTFSRSLEDIHMNVESRLAELVGPAAGRLHTARSRNDQVATDMRLWVRDAVDALDGQLADLQLALAEKALAFADAVMPGFTHLQSAQPVTFGHHLLAYVEMLARDRAVWSRLAGSPISSARRDSTFMWMSSSAVEKANRPSSISPSTARSPSRIASASLSARMPTAASIAAWAREPAMSCGASLRSKPMDALIASMMASGPEAKRPPHIAFEVFSVMRPQGSGMRNFVVAAVYSGALLAANGAAAQDLAALTVTGRSS